MSIAPLYMLAARTMRRREQGKVTHLAAPVRVQLAVYGSNPEAVGAPGFYIRIVFGLRAPAVLRWCADVSVSAVIINPPTFVSSTHL